jgi:hypothetical protein
MCRKHSTRNEGVVLRVSRIWGDDLVVLSCCHAYADVCPSTGASSWTGDPGSIQGSPDGGSASPGLGMVDAASATDAISVWSMQWYSLLLPATSRSLSRST